MHKVWGSHTDSSDMLAIGGTCSATSGNLYPLCRAFGSITRSWFLGGRDSFSMAGDASSGSDSRSDAAAPSGEGCPVQAAWKALPGVVERAAVKGRICHLGPSGVTRQCVIDNVDIIEPVIQTLGALL